MLKRILDIVVSALGLLVLSPLMATIALLILVTMGRPVLFKQERVGYLERTFTLLKFRTMREAFDKDGRPLPDAERITPLGTFLRRTSLDELPQLWNVLRGDMSLVGPRPLLPRYLPYYTPRERLRHRVRPGITGLAQVRGRNNLSWDERLELDVTYVEEHNLLLDLKIIMETVVQTLQRKNVVVIPGQVLKPLDECRKYAPPRTDHPATPSPPFKESSLNPFQPQGWRADR